MAARYARERKVPYLGLCLGMQVMTVEFARHVLDHEDANSTEFDRSTSAPVIDLMIDQRSISDMGGTMRLGLYPCVLQTGTKAAAAYGVASIQERHRHRFEFNNSYRADFERHGNGLFRTVAGRQAGGNRGIGRSSLHDRQPVPSGIPFEAHETSPTLRRPGQGGKGEAPSARSAADDRAFAAGPASQSRASYRLVHLAASPKRPAIRRIPDGASPRCRGWNAPARSG